MTSFFTKKRILSGALAAAYLFTHTGPAIAGIAQSFNTPPEKEPTNVAKVLNGEILSPSAFQTTEQKIDFRDTNAFFTDAKVTRTPDGRTVMVGKVYKMKKEGEEGLYTVGSFRVQGTKNDKGDFTVQEGGESQLTLYGHKAGEFGKHTEFKKIPGEVSFKATSPGNDTLVAQSFGADGKPTMIEPSQEVKAFYSGILTKLVERGNTDIKGIELHTPAGHALKTVGRVPAGFVPI